MNPLENNILAIVGHSPGFSSVEGIVLDIVKCSSIQNSTIPKIYGGRDMEKTNDVTIQCRPEEGGYVRNSWGHNERSTLRREGFRRECRAQTSFTCRDYLLIMEEICSAEFYEKYHYQQLKTLKKVSWIQREGLATGSVWEGSLVKLNLHQLWPPVSKDPLLLSQMFSFPHPCKSNKWHHQLSPGKMQWALNSSSLYLFLCNLSPYRSQNKFLMCIRSWQSSA